jgi:opacity protein-like surface antigen
MHESGPARARRHLAVLLAISLLSAASPAAVRAVELIPFLGATKSTADNAPDAQGYGGLALRFPLLPFLKAEGAISYRQDSFGNGDLKVRQWPVTASLWLAPMPWLYAGGGLGWYRTTLDFSDATQIEDSTNMKSAVHLGGGVELPLATRFGLDFNGRYIFMQKDNNNVQVPTTFDPGFYSLSAGLVIKL